MERTESTEGSGSKSVLGESMKINEIISNTYEVLADYQDKQPQKVLENMLVNVLSNGAGFIV
jgi:hypothetical protein